MRVQIRSLQTRWLFRATLFQHHPQAITQVENWRAPSGSMSVGAMLRHLQSGSVFRPILRSSCGPLTFNLNGEIIILSSADRVAPRKVAVVLAF
jgi:hypothetical protein